MMRSGVIIIALLFAQFVRAQTPVPMATQPGLSYTEDFADLANWTDGFTSGIGANRFGVVPINATGTIPSATRTTLSSAAFTTLGSGGVQKGFGGIALLSTGTTDNTSSVAIDFLMDFTGVTAGTLSYDWMVINNAAGGRNASLRIYYSINGTTFTEMPATAEVLNFTNNTATPTGSVTNIALPAAFNGVSTARLRFYYHNGTGGATGARPKINIDNLKVTATGVTCIAPTAQPTALTFSNITSSSVDGSFTAASAAADEYLVVASNNSTLTSGPVDGTTYIAGDGLGDGVVVSRSSSTTFSATNLSSLSHYYFFIFSVKDFCTGGPLYLSTSPLINDVTTAPGLPDCVPPADQPTALLLTPVSPNIIQGSFTASSANGYVVVRSLSSTLSATPVTGHDYISGEILGNGTVVTSGTNLNFNSTGLNPNTTYHFFVFSYNSQNCLNGPAYNTTAALHSSASTPPLQPCTTPTAQPTALNLTPANNLVFASFVNAATADQYVVVQSTSPTLSATPVDNTNYVKGNALGGGTVIYSGAGNSGFISSGLTSATTYYYFVFAANQNCSGGTRYLTVNPLKGNTTTTSLPASNVYFGNLHAHSDYSDGNKDNATLTPTDDYLYAMGSECMDFLGIAEHNHYTANNNPGNKVANYHMGSTQANAFTSSHPGFLAMYGMEWGVISNGGHVIVYGDGMDQLFGWETGSGAWGATSNYDVFVAKSDYTGANGLFKTINDRSLQNTFATLAHPNISDFNNIANVAYDPVADAAVAGTAVESGPAFSTTTNYTEPSPVSMSFLNYFQTLLAKGYHAGPTVDHDNHNTTFGRTARTRTAVIAPALTKTEFTKGMYQMHFYATEDCDTKVDFSLNTKPMGTIFTDRFAPVINVNLTDATTSLTGAVINLMYGAPGSGILAAKIATATGSSFSFTDNNLANNSTGYYYLDIINGTSRIITSPIWYTRTDGVLPVKLSSFTAQAVNDRVKLNWSTDQEINSKEFIVQHSADGAKWSTVATVAAAGNSSVQKNYNTFDLHPFTGINYYRLQQNDIDGKSAYSDIRTVRFADDAYVVLYPNPVKDVLHVEYKNDNRMIVYQVSNIAGQILKQLRSNTAINLINVSLIGSGVYFLKVMDAGKVMVRKFVVE